MKLLLDFKVQNKAGVCYRFRINKKMSHAPIQKYLNDKKGISEKTVKALNKAAEAEVSKILSELNTIRIICGMGWSVLTCLINLPKKTQLTTYSLPKKVSATDLFIILWSESTRENFDLANIEQISIDYYFSIPKKLEERLGVPNEQ